MTTSQMDEWFAPLRISAHLTIMAVRDANPDRAVIAASLRAILEGTMAAAVQTLGAKDAFNLIQPLTDRALDPAL
jgi:hypothetical protein